MHPRAPAGEVRTPASTGEMYTRASAGEVHTHAPAGEVRPRASAELPPAERRRRPRGAVRDGLVAAGLELARTGGPDAVVLREATRMVGVVPNAAYRHFADRDELLAAVCAAAMDELAARMAAGVARVRGAHGDAAAARRRLGAIGTAYLAFAREEPGLFAAAFALPRQHAYGGPDSGGGPDGGGPDGGAGPDRTPLGQLRTALDELVDAGVLDRRRRDGIEYPVWSTVHGLAVLAGQGPLRDVPETARRRLDELVFAFIQEGLA
jgi:AcrR family transcriptional regulator